MEENTFSDVSNFISTQIFIIILIILAISVIMLIMKVNVEKNMLYKQEERKVEDSEIKEIQISCDSEKNKETTNAFGEHDWSDF